MRHYYNPQLLSPEELHEAHLEMAKNYLENKWENSYYKLEPMPFEYDFHDYRYCVEEILERTRPYYRELTKEQFSEVQKLMKEAGETPLYELLPDDSELMRMLSNDYCDDPKHISDIPHQVCSCMVGVLEPTGQTNTFPYDLMLTEEEYLKLLVIVMDHRKVTFNDLYEYDLDLFKKISEELTSEARKHSERNKKQSYALVFSEIEQDVRNLLGEEDESVELDSSWEENFHSVCVYFSEKKMSVVLMDTPLCSEVEDFAAKYQIMYNIDANDVMRILQVDSYREASIILKNRYACGGAFSLMEHFLDEHKIGYESLEEKVRYEEDVFVEEDL